MSTSVKASLIFMLIGAICSPIIFSATICFIRKISWALLEKYVFEPEETQLNRKVSKLEIGDIVRVVEKRSSFYDKTGVINKRYGDWYDVKFDANKEDFINGKYLKKIL